LKYCDDNKDAELWLSPGGKTIMIALIKAIIKYRRLGSANHGAANIKHGVTPASTQRKGNIHTVQRGHGAEIDIGA
jgi:hypothetical protein